MQVEVNKWWVRALFWGGLVALVVAVYAGGLSNELVFDDFRFIDGTLPLTGPYQPNLGFRGLWAASFPFLHQVLGADLAWQRAFNVALHVLNGWLLWVLVRLLIERALQQEQERPAPGSQVEVGLHGTWEAAARMAVLWWLLNPVAVYSVIYLIQRSTLLAMLFMLLMIIAFIRGLQTFKWYWFAGSAVSYAFVLWSKEHGAPAAALLLPVYVFWCRPGSKALLRIGGGLAVLGLMAGLLMFRLKGWSIGGATEDMVVHYLAELDRVNPKARENVYVLSLINQLWLFLLYGALWFVPWVGWLSIDVRMPFPVQLMSWQLVGALAFLLLVMAAVYLLLRRRGRWALAGLLLVMPAVLFTTELAYVRIQEAFVLYRSYLWSLSWPVAVALGLNQFRQQRWIYLVGVVVAVIFAVMAHDRVQSFRDTVSVWRDALEKIDVNSDANTSVLGRWRAPLNLSMGLLQKKDYAAALQHARLAEKLGAPEGMGSFNQAVALANLGQPEEAVAFFDLAERAGFSRLDVLYKDRANVLAAIGRYDEALSGFDRALELVSDEAAKVDLLIRAGRASNAAGLHDRAVEYYSEVARIRPDLTAAPIGMAYAYYKKGDIDSALRALNQSLARRPTPDVLHARSFIFHQIGNEGRALNDINTALIMAPGNPVYVALRQKILAGKKEESAELPR